MASTITQTLQKNSSTLNDKVMKRILVLSIILQIFFSGFAYIGSTVRRPDHIILGGELGNSSASSKEDIRTIFPNLKEMGLNTVLMPVYWELIEPSEGSFDFSLLDEAISTAEQNDLKLVLLWFGSWKNSMSCYAPGWVKTDTKRFPRAVTEQGKPLEILSSFRSEVIDAELNALN